MVHQNMFGYIDQRLRQITQKVDSYFGGISVILTGKYTKTIHRITISVSIFITKRNLNIILLKLIVFNKKGILVNYYPSADIVCTVKIVPKIQI